IQFAEMVIGLRRAKGLEAAADAVRSGRGERIMGEFEAVVLQLREEELRLLAQRNTEADRRLGQTRAILILGSILALSMTAAAGRSVQRDRTRRSGRRRRFGKAKSGTAGCSRPLRTRWWWWTRAGRSSS